MYMYMYMCVHKTNNKQTEKDLGYLLEALLRCMEHAEDNYYYCYYYYYYYYY